MVLLHLETILSNSLPRSYCLGIKIFEGWAVWFTLWLPQRSALLLPTLSFPRLIFHSRRWWHLDWVTFCGGRCPVQCRVFSRTLDLCPPQASGNPTPTVRTNNISWLCQMSTSTALNLKLKLPGLCPRSCPFPIKENCQDPPALDGVPNRTCRGLCRECITVQCLPLPSPAPFTPTQAVTDPRSTYRFIFFSGLASGGTKYTMDIVFRQLHSSTFLS